MWHLSTSLHSISFGVICTQQLFLQIALHAGEMESEYARQSLADTLTHNEDLSKEMGEIQQQLMEYSRKSKIQTVTQLEADNRRLEKELRACQRSRHKVQDVSKSVRNMTILGSLTRENASMAETVHAEQIDSNPNPNEHAEQIDFVVGIPSVHRKRANYLNNTLHMLFRGEVLRPDEIRRIVVVVHLADADVRVVHQVAKNINHTYFAEITAGRLHVIHAHSNMYPVLDICPADCTYFDEPLRVTWRSKQNIDYAWLMDYSSALGSNLAARFYMQLEDDIQFAPNWVSKARKFIDSQFPPETYRSKENNARWSMIDFSSLGFYGKAVPMRVLPRLASFLRVYYDMMPCDGLIGWWRQAMVQPKKIEYFKQHESLFTHVGVHRTIGGVQLLQERGTLRWDNPPAQVTFICPAISSHKSKVYVDGDVSCSNVSVLPLLTLMFDTPQSLHTILIQMGGHGKPDDYLHHGVLEVASDGCGEYLELMEIDTDATDSIREAKNVVYWSIDDPGQTSLNISKIKCIRLRATRSQTTWLAFSKINVRVQR